MWEASSNPVRVASVCAPRPGHECITVLHNTFSLVRRSKLVLHYNSERRKMFFHGAGPNQGQPACVGKDLNLMMTGFKKASGAKGSAVERAYQGASLRQKDIALRNSNIKFICFREIFVLGSEDFAQNVGAKRNLHIVVPNKDHRSWRHSKQGRNRCPSSN